MSPPRDAASLIWPGEHWHYSIVGGGGRTGKTRRTSSTCQYAGRRSSALPDGRSLRKTVGGQNGGSGVDQMRMALYGKSWSLSCWRTKRLFKRRGYVFEVVDVNE